MKFWWYKRQNLAKTCEDIVKTILSKIGGGKGFKQCSNLKKISACASKM